MPVTSSFNGTTGAVPTLSPDHRHAGIRFESPDGSVGEIAYPINYDELYNLKGRLLTLVDATFTDPAQRKAFKDMVWQTLRGWMEDVEQAAVAHPVDAADAA